MFPPHKFRKEAVRKTNLQTECCGTTDSDIKTDEYLSVNWIYAKACLKRLAFGVKAIFQIEFEPQEPFFSLTQQGPLIEVIYCRYIGEGRGNCEGR
jgi:hypothetical protein